MALTEEDETAIALAQVHVKTYPVPTEPSSPQRFGRLSINPKDILRAALNFAPTEQGRLNVAKASMDTVKGSTGTICNGLFEDYARQIVNNLLVPC